MASGLNLYILTSTLLGIVQNYFVHVSDEELKAKSGSAPKKKARPKHFYAAAQARKREMAREERRGKKKGPRGKDSGKD
jgi:membrane protein insertase Oxa1/YidC/SpoIIIJ